MFKVLFYYLFSSKSHLLASGAFLLCMDVLWQGSVKENSTNQLLAQRNDTFQILVKGKSHITSVFPLNACRVKKEKKKSLPKYFHFPFASHPSKKFYAFITFSLLPSHFKKYDTFWLTCFRCFGWLSFDWIYFYYYDLFIMIFAVIHY